MKPIYIDLLVLLIVSLLSGTIGWKINDVIAFKMIQNIFIAIFAFFSALVCAYLYIFLFDAHLLHKYFSSKIVNFLFKV